MSLQPIVAILSLLILNSLVPATQSFSLNQEDFRKLVAPNCFRQDVYNKQDLIFGQTEPIGLSIENLISLIERLELKFPDWKPETIIALLLQRFHHDGLHLVNGQNQQSTVEYQHGLLTQSILSQKTPVVPFPEELIFTENEKCNLFFTLSHVVNKTVLPGEPLDNTRLVQNKSKMSKSQPVLSDKDKQAKLTTTTTLAPPKAIQSKFLDSLAKPSVPKSGKQKRDTNILYANRESKTPREYGVASFLSNPKTAVAMSRVLLGLFVGFAQPNSVSMQEALNGLPTKLELRKDVTNENLDMLYAVTLADLLAITNEEQNAMGADGEWNTTGCQIAYLLKSTLSDNSYDSGYWATLAEFRGGLDGFNLGYELSSMLKVTPLITASQALRFYYSKFGLSTKTGICNRGYYINNDISKEILPESRKYAKLWNAIHRSNIYENNHIDGFIDDLKPMFVEKLQQAAKLNEDETLLCASPPPNEIQARPCETSLDMFFVLDAQDKCVEKNGYCKSSDVVATLTKGLPFSRKAGGTVSVLYNLKSVNNPSLVDDDKKPVTTSGLFASLFNSTSSQCASCRALYFDTNNQAPITSRNQLLDSINDVIEQFEQGRANQTGVPGKIVVWLDNGSVQPIPTDKIQQVQYDKLKRQLLSVQRDVTFVGVAKNITSLKDIVTTPEYLVTLDDNYGNDNALATLRGKLCEAAPSVFQYNSFVSDNCSQSSRNTVYEGFITPGYKQYWAMHPDSFIRSGRLQLSFQAENAAIQVCYDRAIKPEARRVNCKIADKKGGILEWNVPNPCSQSFEKCAGLYFTVSVENVDNLGYCQDKRCFSLNQVKWTFNHTGARCNSASHLFSSIPSFFIVSILVFFLNL